TNLGSPRLAGVRLRNELEARGRRYDDATSGPSRGGRVVSECYPYTTIVGVAELGYDQERPLYKRKPPKMPVARWHPIRAAACDELVRRIASLRDASPPIDLRSHATTAKLVTEPSPLDYVSYKHRE